MFSERHQGVGLELWTLKKGTNITGLTRAEATVRTAFDLWYFHCSGEQLTTFLDAILDTWTASEWWQVWKIFTRHSTDCKMLVEHVCSFNVDENNSSRMSSVIDVDELFLVTKKTNFNLAFQWRTRRISGYQPFVWPGWFHALIWSNQSEPEVRVSFVGGWRVGTLLWGKCAGTITTQRSSEHKPGPLLSLGLRANIYTCWQ